MRFLDLSVFSNTSFFNFKSLLEKKEGSLWQIFVHSFTFFQFLCNIPHHLRTVHIFHDTDQRYHY